MSALVLASITFHSILVFIHVTAAVVGLGATFALALAFPLAVRMAEPRALLFMHRLSLDVTRKLASPALLVILITGIWQAADGDFDFGSPWISATFVIVIVLGGLQGAYFTRTDRKLIAMIEKELGAGATALSAEYQKEANREGGMGALAGLLIVVAIFLMVTKPG
jgi:uncharacterized membrane protein